MIPDIKFLITFADDILILIAITYIFFTNFTNFINSL
jgi:hypothetical protein